MCDVDALVALEPDQARAEDVRERLRDLGLAHAGLALEQQRLAQLERNVEHRREAPIGQIRALAEGGAQVVDRGGLDSAHAPQHRAVRPFDPPVEGPRGFRKDPVRVP